MEGGVGVASYAKNSAFQSSAFSLVAPAIRNAIALHCKSVNSSQSVVRVADLGCSSGPNTISAVDMVVEAFKDKFKLAGSSDFPEFQAFYSDVKSNDFNTLFNLDFGSSDVASNKTFIAGVPGSFYGRLFPYSSIHFAMSSVALNWISKIPDAILDDQSEYWNGGSISADRASPKVAEAYQQQAHEDLCNFLKFRGEEIIPGGLLCLLINARKSDDPSRQTEDGSDIVNWFYNYLHFAFQDMTSEGLIDEKTRDSFNIPCFHRTGEEIVRAVDESGHCFKVLKLEMIDPLKPAYGEVAARAAAAGLRVPSWEEHTQSEVMFLKSFSKKLVETHLKYDGQLVEELYKRLERRLLMQQPLFSRHLPMSFVILERTNN